MNLEERYALRFRNCLSIVAILIFVAGCASEGAPVVPGGTAIINADVSGAERNPGIFFTHVARALIYRGASEDDQHFGVYSYLLATQKDAGSPVGQRLRAAIDAYSREAPYCSAIDPNPARVDLFAVPVMTSNPMGGNRSLCEDSAVVAAQLCDNYDTERASQLIDTAGLDGPGPYLVASLTPLSTLPVDQQTGLLVWDVSTAELKLVRLAVDDFIDSANRPDDWNKITLRRWAFELRNFIALASEGWSVSNEAAKNLIHVPE